jgi:hypothetical protein
MQILHRLDDNGQVFHREAVCTVREAGDVPGGSVVDDIGFVI